MYTVRLPALMAGGVHSNSKVTAPAVPNREPLSVCSMYWSAIPLVVQALPKTWLRKVVCVQTSWVNPSAPGGKGPCLRTGAVGLARGELEAPTFLGGVRDRHHEMLLRAGCIGESAGKVHGHAARSGGSAVAARASILTRDTGNAGVQPAEVGQKQDGQRRADCRRLCDASEGPWRHGAAW